MPIPRHAFPPGGDVLHLLCQDAACAAVALQPFPNLSVPLAVQYQEESFPHQCACSTVLSFGGLTNNEYLD